MLIIPANSAVSGGFDVANSCRFNHAGDDRMDRTVESPTLGTKWTFSTWVKKDNNGDYHHILTTTANPGNWDTIRFSNGDTLQILLKDAATNLTTTQLFRDNSAFYSIIVAFDSTQGTASSRLKLYINGTQVTSFSTATYPTENLIPNYQVSGKTLRIGANTWSIGTGHEKLGGVICETVFIDGVAHAPTDFGEFDEDSGIWKPIDVSSLTFGNNGFYLDYQDSSALGNDVSGNDNDFTTVNLAAIDQSIDTCTNNFCVMNVLDGSQWQTLSEGNLKIVNSSPASSFGLTKGSIGVTKGKWYWEVKYTFGSSAGHFGFFKVSDTAIANEEDINGNLFTVAGQGNGVFTGIAFRIDDGGNIKRVFNGNVADTNVDFSSGDILGLAFDGDSGKLYAFKNGTELTGQNISNGTSLMSAVTMDDIFLPFVSNGDGGSGTKTGTSEFNFGSPPYSESGGNSDGDGFGNFKTAPPSGYFALNTKNLAEYG